MHTKSAKAESGKGLFTERNAYLIKNSSVRIVLKVLRALFLFGLCYLFLFPLFYMLSTAMQSPESAADPSVIWLPRELSFNSIQTAVRFLNYWSSMALTGSVAVFSTLGTLLSCSLVGYSLARFKYPGRNLTFALVLLTIIVPPQTLIMSSYVNFRFFDFGGILSLFGGKYINLINTQWTFILPSLFASGLRAGIFIFIFRQFFSGMPKDLEEAAKIDGCGVLKTFLRIIVPLAVPAFITVCLFSFIWHWNEYYSSSMYFTEGSMRFLSVQLRDLSESLKQGGLVSGGSPLHIRTYLQAGAFMTVLPPLILYVFTQRYFTESIERTGIVG